MIFQCALHATLDISRNSKIGVVNIFGKHLTNIDSFCYPYLFIVLLNSFYLLKHIIDSQQENGSYGIFQSLL